ncbi:MAG: porin [Pseudomonadota bacterium]
MPKWRLPPAAHAAALMVWAATPAAADDVEMSVRWLGLVPEFSTADGAFRIRPRGRLQFDVSATEDSRFELRNRAGTEVRSALVGVEGDLKPLTYSVLVDFSNHTTNFRNAYLAWRGPTPVGDLELSFGNRLTERSMEGSGSSETAPFLERNVVATAIVPLKGSYGMGVTSRLYGRNWHLAAQVAGDDINDPDITRDTVTTSLRGHWNPVATKDLAVHLGAWGFHENFSDRVNRLSRNTFWGGQHFNDALQVSLGLVERPRSADAVGLELGAFGRRAWSLMEYGQRDIAARPSHVVVRAWAAEAGMTLTDDRPPYGRRGGVFVRQAPAAPLSRGGPGAVEISGRWEHLDNTDAPLGGLGDAVTVGLTWRPEEWLRLTMNASRWSLEQRTGGFTGEDDGESVTTRLQLSF